MEQCCSPFACQDYDCNCEAGPAAYPSSRASSTEPSTTAAIEVGQRWPNFAVNVGPSAVAIACDFIEFSSLAFIIAPLLIVADGRR